MSARKLPHERSNRERPIYDDIPIAWDGEIRGDPLPSDYEWCDMTKKWWEMVRRSPQAMAFQPTDWWYLLETARLHNVYWRPTDGRGLSANALSQLAGELRIRLERYGFTWADRRKYGIHITTKEQVASEAESATRSAAVDYRKRLNGLA